MYTFTRGLLICAVVLTPTFGAGQEAARSSADPQPLKVIYSSPRPGALGVRPETTIAIRTERRIAPNSLDTGVFEVVGTKSGPHTGTVVLADDGATVIFRPTFPFAWGEQVDITFHETLRTIEGNQVAGQSFSFSTRKRDASGADLYFIAEAIPDGVADQAPSLALDRTASSVRLTLPPDFPLITATVTNTTTTGEYYFLAPFNPATNTGGYLVIMDSAGEPVYYQPVTAALDFKRQSNGNLTYFDFQDGLFYEIDSTYSIVNEYSAGNGYPTDGHELLLLENGHALLMIYDSQPVDMSEVVEGGQPDATVIGLILQEIDTQDNVVFEWRSWDHFFITDTQVSLTTPVIDYVHGNAIEVDDDGNWLVSSRHLSEITKIDRQTGDVMWRLGGNRNEFTFTNEPAPYFDFQHDVRRLPSGNLSIFDNRTNQMPSFSRAIEFSLDENVLTATRVSELRTTPDTYSFAMGNAQRLPDGGTVIGWGTAGRVTELDTSGTPVFDLSLALWNYRAFRMPWVGHPTWTPTLVVQEENGKHRLAYSWNGATEIASYRVYGGSAPHPATLIDSPDKLGFETQTIVDHPSGGCYFYSVTPIDNSGNVMVSSPEVTNCPYHQIITFLGRP